MTDSAKAAPRPGWLRAGWSRARRPDAPSGAGRPAWLPVWSVPAAMRAVRATIVMPSLFAVTFLVIGNPQMTLFAVFGSFATLVFASFGGSRRDKAIAHLGLAVVGSIALIIGTLVSGIAWLATLVTIPVTFAIFFAGVVSPNSASGVTAAMLAYVLPVAALAEPGTIPSRLAGWWMASIAGTAAVLLFSPRPPGDKLRATTAAAATTLAKHIDAALAGTATPAEREASLAAQHELKKTFVAGPFRPTGLAAPDQGLANVIELLQWCIELTTDTLDGHVDLARAAPADLELLRHSADLLNTIAAVLSGKDAELDLAPLEAAIAAGAADASDQWEMGDPDSVRASAAVAAHVQAIAIAVRATAADALIAARKADPELVAAERRRWYGHQEGTALSHAPALAGLAGFMARYASTRSVWFRNSARGSIALALAVAVAYATGVQHGFWVILGTLSVLRTTAASTGSTAMRALGGTVAGFALGAALLLAIGTGPTALWIVLPFAVFVAAYSPGTMPFLVGQAAFTVTVVVIFNLLVPAGWKVGLLRIEDVALGCAVSLVIGILFWPRGTSALVGDDLADAFRRGAMYLTQAVDWALGARQAPPDSAVAAVSAGSRVDEALRQFLTEQGTRRLATHDLWTLVMATTRLRLTAYAVASLPASQLAVDGQPGHNGDRAPGHDGTGRPDPHAKSSGTPVGGAGDGTEALAAFRHETAELARFYEQVAVQVGPPSHQQPALLTVPDLHGPGFPQGVACAENTPADYRPDMLWVGEYLYHLADHAEAITVPAEKVAQARQRPWWR